MDLPPLITVNATYTQASPMRVEMDRTPAFSVTNEDRRTHLMAKVEVVGSTWVSIPPGRTYSFQNTMAIPAVEFYHTGTPVFMGSPDDPTEILLAAQTPVITASLTAKV